jgi:phosphoribosylaminoimidazole (AIR) synthetase
MGVGMIAVCASEHAGDVAARLKDAGESAWVIGEVTKGARGVNIV